MELGLSLGHASKFSEKISKNDQQQKNSFGNGGLDFYMALGLINSHSEIEKTQKNLDGDEDDDRINTSRESPVQLDLLPLAPVHRRISFDNGSSENGSSENAAAKGLQRIPAAAEEASSANSVGCLDLGVCGSKRGFEGKGNDAVVESSRSGGDGDDDDDDENGANTRKKLRLSKEQSAFLEDCFIQHHTLNPKQKLALAKQLNLRPRQVEVWFQNRRARTKLKQTEVDCEYLKRCCETLTDENRRLQKELQELRALKVSNPYCMQSPPTTLTMCPSCEHIAATGNGKIARNDHTIPKPIPFPLSRPKFFPFSQSSIHPNQPAAS